MCDNGRRYGVITEQAFPVQGENCSFSEVGTPETDSDTNDEEDDK